MIGEPELECLSIWKLTGVFSLSPVNQPDSSVFRVPFFFASDNAATQWQFIDMLLLLLQCFPPSQILSFVGSFMLMVPSSVFILYTCH